MKRKKRTLKDLIHGRNQKYHKTQEELPKMPKIFSDAQAARRLKWDVANKLGSKLKGALHYSVDDIIRMSDYNYFVKTTMLKAITGEYPQYSIDYNKVKIADGRLDPVFKPSLELSVSGFGLLLRWYGDPYQENTDELSVVIYNKTKDRVDQYNDLASRAASQASLMYPSSDLNDELHCWIYLKSITRKAFSPSQYIAL
jgi:hypothetical protein